MTSRESIVCAYTYVGEDDFEQTTEYQHMVLPISIKVHDVTSNMHMGEDSTRN